MKPLQPFPLVLLALALTACRAPRTESAPAEPEVAFEVVALHYASANALAQMIERLDIEGVRAVSDARTNSLLLRATPERIAKVRALVGEVDVAVLPAGDDDAAHAQTAIIPLRHAEAKEVADLLRRLVRDAHGKPPADMRIEPDERTNSLIVVGDGRAFGHVRELVTRLDVQAGG